VSRDPRGDAPVSHESPEGAADLAARIRAGDRGALARALTRIENRAPAAADPLLDIARRHVGAAQRIGFTGPPGAGKSTLITQVARRYRALERRVGVLAVDPTSPFTGGALLGDRIRMAALGGDPGVFVRSMATRGHHGGLASAVVDAADLLDLAGFDRVLIESVGVGQNELEIAGAAHQVVVVLVPEAGDEVQSLKAGLTEIGDVMVVNKADRPGAEAMAEHLRDALALRGDAARSVAVLLVEATTGRGVDELVHALESGAAGAGDRARDRRRRAIRARLLGIVAETLSARVDAEWAAALDQAAAAVSAGETTPEDAAGAILDRFLGAERGRRRGGAAAGG
jgi:LAO/AO transport system kinase